uniref:Uncharacterized protein n=1 Tax=Zooxanthella nutricula TaxID=1333877 RepID=A0A7S2I565_9DINO
MTFAAVLFAPGARAKELAAGFASATMLGTYLISCTLNSGQWFTDAMDWVCPCQCSEADLFGQILAVSLISLVIVVAFGYPFQILLLRGVVPAIVAVAAPVAANASSLLERGIRGGFLRLPTPEDESNRIRTMRVGSNL